MGILRTHIGIANAHAGKNNESLYLKKTGSLISVSPSSAALLNIIFVRPKKSSPKNFAPSAARPVGISDLKNTVKAIIDIIVIWKVLNMYRRSYASSITIP